MASQPTSRSSADRRGNERGFALLEIICVLAIVGLLAAIVIPAFPKQTSRAQVLAYATEVATILKMDRAAAYRRNRTVATIASASARQIRSAASGFAHQVPRDVRVDTLLASRCRGMPAVETIQFEPSGRSCGGTIALSTSAARYEVRVNWLTGGVEVVEGRQI